MAKKVIQNDKQDDIAVGDTPPAPEPDKPNEAPSALKGEKNPDSKQSPHEIPEHAVRILKAFSNYPALYIDFQGGTFTVDTPPAFRSNATLYTNPYHKS